MFTAFIIYACLLISVSCYPCLLLLPLNNQNHEHALYCLLLVVFSAHLFFFYYHYFWFFMLVSFCFKITFHLFRLDCKSSFFSAVIPMLSPNAHFNITILQVLCSTLQLFVHWLQFLIISSKNTVNIARLNPPQTFSCHECIHSPVILSNITDSILVCALGHSN